MGHASLLVKPYTMELYLVQHGAAAASADDPKRPLTPHGREHVSRMARSLARVRLRVETIYHSGKLRAEQTAQILGGALAPPGGLRQLAGLAPNDDPAAAAARLKGLTGPVMIVGHLSHLTRLTSLLLSGETADEIVAFRNAGIVCLESTPQETWRVQWYLIPELIDR